jgi:hypothetical protein
MKHCFASTAMAVARVGHSRSERLPLSSSAGLTRASISFAKGFTEV